MAVLALGTQNRDADIITPRLALSKWNPASTVAPLRRDISLAHNTLVVTRGTKAVVRYA
jgi:hypothetical protein